MLARNIARSTPIIYDSTKLVMIAAITRIPHAVTVISVANPAQAEQ
jgi:hypothetical protein